MNGIHQNGKATFTAGGPLAKGEFVKLADGKAVKCTDAGDGAVGVALDGAEKGAYVPVQLLVSGDTVPVKAGGAVAQGGSLTCLGTTDVSPGTLQYGIALEAASDAGDIIEAMVGLPAIHTIA